MKKLALLALTVLSLNTYGMTIKLNRIQEVENNKRMTPHSGSILLVSNNGELEVYNNKKAINRYYDKRDTKLSTVSSEFSYSGYDDDGMYFGVVEYITPSSEYDGKAKEYVQFILDSKKDIVRDAKR